MRQLVSFIISNFAAARMTYLGHVMLASILSLCKHTIHQQPPVVNDVVSIDVDTLRKVFRYELTRVRCDARMPLLELCSCPYDWEDPAADLWESLTMASSTWILRWWYWTIYGVYKRSKDLGDEGDSVRVLSVGFHGLSTGTVGEKVIGSTLD